MSARVLFLAADGLGHVFPMVPLAWAMRAAGHEVLVATTGFGLAAADAGLPVADYAPDTPQGAEWHAGLAATPRLLADTYGVPDLAERMREGAEPVDIRMSSAMLAGFAEAIVDNAVAIALGFRPDLVIHESMCPAGVVVAAALGVPAVRLELNPARTTELSEHMLRHLAPTFARFGATPAPDAAVLDRTPPSMVVEPGGVPLRFVPYTGGTVDPPTGPPPSERRRVLVTIGTTLPEVTDAGSLVGRLAAAMADLDAEVLLAVGGADPAALGPLPPGMSTVGWAPLESLVPDVSAVVHHGGAGTTFECLRAGVPQVVLPHSRDTPVNAGAVAARGAGLAVDPADFTAAHVAAVLDDPRYAAAAAEVRREMAAMPAPSEVVPTLTGPAVAGDRRENAQVAV
ncbi:nucleotide disphospho-sugar-binding domain-containing protein [Actinokineospora sp. UTMC 2448]|uniref:nucleotide disphospho-sugar-binding domain-containing protein n=1 Tax=Actinokineospora sp. UTMC 2448 TaxID=2268449 RepID=UPI0021640E09|nr:nucleotide disphospho-sugar-binding domain-containing protein [Actinokineospora sp. UTMC 2448]UVS78688.1 Glycosyltransferase PerS6 [Actinokineospora sp. UTMC 2448]